MSVTHLTLISCVSQYFIKSLILYSNSFVSNPDEKDLLSQKQIQNDRSQITKPNIFSGDDLFHDAKSDSKGTDPPNKDIKDIEGQISISIQAEKNASSSFGKNKTLITRLKSKQNISDNVSVMLSEDNFSDCPPDNNKQELDYQPSSDQKEESEKDKELHMFSEDDIPPNTENVRDKTSMIRQNSLKEPYKISVSIGEFLISYLYQSETLKQKMQILEEGTKRLNSRLDAVTILRKMRDVDKLKAMFFDMDQALLFNSLPKPELRSKSLAKNEDNVPIDSPYGLFKKFTLREHNLPRSSIRDIHNKVHYVVKTANFVVQMSIFRLKILMQKSG